MTTETDPYKKIQKTDRLYCNVNNKNSLPFTCFSENDIYELVSLYNKDIANTKSEDDIKKKNKKEIYPHISIRYNNNKKSIKEIYNELKKNLSRYK